MNQLLPLIILIPFVVAIAMLFGGKLSKLTLDSFALIAILAVASFVKWLYLVRPFNTLLISHLGTTLILDGLSHLILVIANVLALFIIIYATAYAGKYANKERFYALFFMMLAGVNGVILTGNLLVLFIFLEIAALCAYALVAFGEEKAGIEAALKYFLIGEVASIAILLAFGLIYSITGTLNMAEAGHYLLTGSPQLKSFIIVLLISGFGMKAALFPFHAWLPDAHTAAPAPVSAMLSGVIIKALGIYALVRILFNIFGLTPPVAMVLTGLAVVSILIGGLLAIGQWDMKRLMAYSSISQVGYIILGLSLGTPLGILGGLFHLFNHAFMKGLLFLNAGVVERQTGSRDLRELGGLKEKMPFTAFTSLIGSLSISGVPPFNGFWSKLFIIVACVQVGNLWLAAAAVFGSILTMAAFLKIQKYAFFGQLKNKYKDLKEAPLAMNISLGTLALACLAVGLAFSLVIGFVINPAVVAVANGVGYSRMILGRF